MELGRTSNFEDLLQRTPGVFLQPENGVEVAALSHAEVFRDADAFYGGVSWSW